MTTRLPTLRAVNCLSAIILSIVLGQTPSISAASVLLYAMRSIFPFKAFLQGPDTPASRHVALRREAGTS